MRPEVLAAIALLFVGGAAVLLRRRLDEAPQGLALPSISLANLAEELRGAVSAPIDAELAARNVHAFGEMVAAAEGTARYGADAFRVLFGGAVWDGPMDDHPRQARQFTDKAGRRLWTSAAGKWQFMAVSPLPGGGATRVDTWDRLARKLQLPDFGPESQFRAFVELLDEAGALLDVQAGRFDQAVHKVRRIWASLPGAGYAQHEQRLETLRTAYADAGGTFA